VLSSIRRLVAKTAPAQTVSSAERRALRAEPRLRPTRPVGDAVEQKLVLSPSQRVSEPENPWAVIPLDPADHASGDERAWAREDRLADYADGGASPSAAPQDALGAALAAAAEGLRGPAASPAGAVQQDASPQAAIPPAADPLPDQADAAQQDAPERHHNFISTEVADEDGYDEEVETLTLFAAAAIEGQAQSGAPPVYTIEPEPEGQEDDLATEDPVDDLGHAPHMRFAAKEADLILAEQDEVALRALVARVVREELQGDLGQRITSNLRKLVRREIRMILAAEKLDG
jgi:hypothetical protein